MCSVTPYHKPSGQSLLGDVLRWENGSATWRPRGSGDWLLMLGLRGQGFLTARQVRREIPPGTHVLIPPGIPHDYGSLGGGPEDRWDLLWLHFDPRPHWLPWLRWPEGAPGVPWLEPGPEAENQRAAASFTRVHEALRTGHAWAQDLARCALEQHLLELQPRGQARTTAPLDPRVAAARQLLGSGSEASLPQLAQGLGLSYSRLAHLFREHTGESLLAYGERLRLERARDRLAATNEPIRTIAEELGFPDAFYFSKRFRRFAGVSPSAYRRDGGHLR